MRLLGSVPHVELSNTLVGIEREHLAEVRAKLRELSQQHANEIGRETEITFRVAQERRVWFTPD